jgi:DNA mismatch endonuclease (patch repair protein)
MADVFSKKKRSSIMAASKSSGTSSTERRMRARLASAGIVGWRLNPRDIHGNPDLAFDRERVAVFLDGCFWHGCKKCRSIPKTHRGFWSRKILANKSRDRAVNRSLRRQGWTVIRLWEHQLRLDLSGCIDVIKAPITNQRG